MCNLVWLMPNNELIYIHTGYTHYFHLVIMTKLLNMDLTVFMLTFTAIHF